MKKWTIWSVMFAICMSLAVWNVACSDGNTGTKKDAAAEKSVPDTASGKDEAAVKDEASSNKEADVKEKEEAKEEGGQEKPTSRPAP